MNSDIALLGVANAMESEDFSNNNVNRVYSWNILDQLIHEIVISTTCKPKLNNRMAKTIQIFTVFMSREMYS